MDRATERLYFCLYRNLLQRYERRLKMSKMWWFGVLRVTQGHWKWHHLIQRMQVPISVP